MTTGKRVSGCRLEAFSGYGREHLERSRSPDYGFQDPHPKQGGKQGREEGETLLFRDAPDEEAYS